LNQKQRLQIHENILYKLHFARLYSQERFLHILDLIGAWSFASNRNNGIQTEAEIKKNQDRILKLMGDL
jgi:hypothetical protein